MNLIVLTNNFLQPHHILPEDEDADIYYDYVTLPNLDALEEMSYQPLLVTSVVYSYNLTSAEPRALGKLIRGIQQGHDQNTLLLTASMGDSIQVRNKLADLEIPHKTINCNYIDIDTFNRFVSDSGFGVTESTVELHKRLKGNLSNCIPYLFELQRNKPIDRVISPEARADYSTFLGVFLGIDTSIVKQRRLLRILRREHPAYLMAILLSQLRQLRQLKVNQSEIQANPKLFAKLNVDKKIFDRYHNKLNLISLPSLDMLIHKITKMKSTEAVFTEILMYSWTGGYIPREEEDINAF